MSGHKKWEDVKKERGFESSKDTPLSELQPGKYWKTWTRKYKKEEPGRWSRHKRQRIQYGYSVYDWWNFDSYIAGVIAHAVGRFAREGMGHPMSHTEASWKQLCLSISEPLSKWACEDRWTLSLDDSLELYRQVQEALHKFADNFGGFWD